jgi:hypothetical protein
MLIVGFDFLMIMFEDYYGYKREDIVMLTDDSTNARMMATSSLRTSQCIIYDNYQLFLYCLIICSLAASNGMACTWCCAQ